MVKQQAPNHQKFWDETEVRPGAFCSLCTCPLQTQVEWRCLVTPERETGGREMPLEPSISCPYLLMQEIPLTKGSVIYSIIRNSQNTGLGLPWWRRG